MAGWVVACRTAFKTESKRVQIEQRTTGMREVYQCIGANANDSDDALALVDAISPLYGASDRGSGRTVWSGIAATTRHSARFRTRHLFPCWPCAAPRMGVAWADGGGSWSKPSPDSISFAAYGCHVKRADIHEAFLSLGCALICWQSLRQTWKTT